MKILDLLSEDLIIADLEAEARDEVLDEIVRCALALHPYIDARRAQRVLIERERLGSTAIGEGLAIPHARLEGLTKPVACFARSVRGVDFKALDGAPTHLFLALFAPVGAAALHLTALARATRMFKDEGFRARLLSAEGPRELWTIIAEKDDALSSQT